MAYILRNLLHLKRNKTNYYSIIDGFESFDEAIRNFSRFADEITSLTNFENEFENIPSQYNRKRLRLDCELYFRRLSNCSSVQDIVDFLLEDLNTLTMSVINDKVNVGVFLTSYYENSETTPLGIRNYSFYYENNSKVENVLLFAGATELNDIFGLLFVNLVDRVMQSINSNKPKLVDSPNPSDSVVYYYRSQTFSRENFTEVVDLINSFSSKQYTTKERPARRTTKSAKSDSSESTNNTQRRTFTSIPSGNRLPYQLNDDGSVVISIRFSSITDFRNNFLPSLRKDIISRIQ